VRAAAGPLPMALFRRAHHVAKVRTTGAQILVDAPFGAHRQLFAILDGRGARAAESRAVAIVGGVAVREAQA
jgi:hypothetical protein